MKKNNKKISICFVSAASTLTGGGERSLIELITELSKMNVLCHVILPSNGPMEDELNKLNILYSIVSYRKWLIREGECKQEIIKNVFKQSFQVIEKIKSINPDIIYTNTSVVNIGAVTAQALQIPHVWHIREYDTSTHGLNFALALHEKNSYIDLNSDVVIFNSKTLKEYYLQYSDFKNSKVVYNNVNIKKPDGLVKNKYFKNKNSIKLTVIGRVCEGKGQRDVVLAVKDLLKEGFEVELVIAGGINELDLYVKSIKKIIHKYSLKAVKLAGHVSDTENLIDESDIVIVASKEESFGRVTIESMLLKRLVIGARSGGTQELIKDNVNGLLYEVGDVEDLKEKIKFAINNKKEVEQMIENGFNYARDSFSKKEYSYKIYNIFKKLINKDDRKDNNFFDTQKIILEKIVENSSCKKSKSLKFLNIHKKYICYKNGFKFIVFSPKKFLKKYFKF